MVAEERPLRIALFSLCLFRGIWEYMSAQSQEDDEKMFLI